MQGKKCKWKNEASTIKKKVILFIYQKLHLWGREEVKYKVLLGKPKRKRPLGRTRHRWVGSIKMDLQEV